MPVYRAFEDRQAALMFLTTMLKGVRRVELLSLRWRRVRLTDPDGACVVVERGNTKTNSGARVIAPRRCSLRAPGAVGLQGRRRARLLPPREGDADCRQGYAEKFRAALTAVGITEYVRPFHDARHSALTNLALDATNATYLQMTARHSDLKTTQHSVHLAGQTFPEEAKALEARYGLTLAAEPEREKVEG